MEARFSSAQEKLTLKREKRHRSMREALQKQSLLLTRTVGENEERRRARVAKALSGYAVRARNAAAARNDRATTGDEEWRALLEDGTPNNNSAITNNANNNLSNNSNNNNCTDDSTPIQE